MTSALPTVHRCDGNGKSILLAGALTRLGLLAAPRRRWRHLRLQNRSATLRDAAFTAAAVLIVTNIIELRPCPL
jgi:hypothetical protein